MGDGMDGIFKLLGCISGLIQFAAKLYCTRLSNILNFREFAIRECHECHGMLSILICRMRERTAPQFKI